MDQRSRIAIAGIVVAVGSMLLFLPSDAQTKKDVFKIGVLFPLSGEAASYGEKGQRGIELALEQAREKAILGGRSFAVVYEDSKAEPAVGATAMRKLVSVDKVPVVIGDIVSAVTLAAAPIAERSKVVLLSPTSSAPAITNAGEYIFRIWPSDLAEGQAIAEWALKRGFRKAAILHLQNDYGTSIADIFSAVLQKSGATVVARTAYLANAPDYRSALTRVREVSPDVVYVAGYYADTALILKQARELGLTVPFLGTTAVEDKKFLELAGGAAEGLVYPLATGFDAASTVPITRKFVRNFKTKYGYEPGWVEAQAFDAFMVVVQAAKNSGPSITGTAIKAGLDNLGQFEGVAGAIKFDINGDVTKPIQIKTVKSGAFQALQ